MKSAVAIKHVSFENLGSWEKLISQRFNIKYVDAIQEIPQLKNENIDLLVVLGGPIGVYQEKEYPFIKDEIALLENRFKLDLPTLGICLGCQLMARALGSKVYPNHTKEIGWAPLTLTDAGKNSFVQPLSPDETSMFHWHGDTFDLPQDAELLASTPYCTNQIFAWGKNALAFQCHPEVNAKQLEYWWVGHASELSQNNLSVIDLREKSEELTPQLERQSLKCLQEWLNISCFY